MVSLSLGVALSACAGTPKLADLDTERVSVAATEADSRTFAWPKPFYAGDCGSESVSVVIRADGSGHLKSVSWTNSTWLADHWWWSITGYDADQVPLWSTSEHEGPGMWPGRRFHDDFDFTFDVAKYPATKFIGLRYRC